MQITLETLPFIIPETEMDRISLIRFVEYEICNIQKSKDCDIITAILILASRCSCRVDDLEDYISENQDLKSKIIAFIQSTNDKEFNKYLDRSELILSDNLTQFGF